LQKGDTEVGTAREVGVLHAPSKEGQAEIGMVLCPAFAAPSKGGREVKR